MCSPLKIIQEHDFPISKGSLRESVASGGSLKGL
jgi:hypothetical protein